MIAGLFSWLMATALVFVAVFRAFDRAEPAEPTGPRPVAVGFVVLTAYVLVMAHDTMWLPAERLPVEGRVTTAYVLDEEADRLVVLRDGDRRVLVLDRATVTDRDYCTKQTPWLGDSLLQIVTRPRYPRCED